MNKTRRLLSEHCHRKSKVNEEAKTIEFKDIEFAYKIVWSREL